MDLINQENFWSWLKNANVNLEQEIFWIESRIWKFKKGHVMKSYRYFFWYNMPDLFRALTHNNRENFWSWLENANANPEQEIFWIELRIGKFKKCDEKPIMDYCKSSLDIRRVPYCYQKSFPITFLSPFLTLNFQTQK